jgi:hypothetical protein
MTTTHRIGISVALALTLAASAAPASARPVDLNANGSYVTAGTASMQAASQTTGAPPILAAPNPAQRAALRKAQQQQLLAYSAYNPPKSAKYSSAEMNAYAYTTHTRIPNTVAHAASHHGGFDWGDAGIGAAGGLGLTLVGVGGAFAITHQRRARRSEGSAVITS